jgi:hypothetical protein
MRRLIENSRFDPFLVAGGALTVRLIYIGQVVSTPIFHGLALDSLLYDRLARQIAGGNWGHKDSILSFRFTGRDRACAGREPPRFEKVRSAPSAGGASLFPGELQFRWDGRQTRNGHPLHQPCDHPHQSE